MNKSVCLCLGMLFFGQAFAQTKVLNEWQEPLTGMRFVALPKGCFEMGTNEPVQPKWDSFWESLGFEGNLSEDEKPRHQVCVDDFFFGKYEVRWGEWGRLMGNNGQSKKDDEPVSGVTWQQVQQYAQRLSITSGGEFRYRLPTEAEWEYACRAGEKNIDQSVVDNLKEKAWHNTAGMRPREPQPVGRLAGNPFGLHDVLGNVWEWVTDDYAENAYQRHNLYNPKIVEGGPLKVIRGGSHLTESLQTRCGKRGKYSGAETLPQIGFRLVRDK